MPSSEPGRRALLLLRHAKSDWAEPNRTDLERPLSARGKRSAAEVATTFLSGVPAPQLVICSPSIRTIATYEAIRAAIPTSRLYLDPGAYLAPAGELLTSLREVDDEVSSLLLIGHNPGISGLLTLLDPAASARDPELADLPTAALVHLEFDCPWSQLASGSARLHDVYLHRGLKEVRP